MEATGYAQWFERKLGHELWGDAAEFRAAMVRKQKMTIADLDVGRSSSTSCPRCARLLSSAAQRGQDR